MTRHARAPSTRHLPAVHLGDLTYSLSTHWSVLSGVVSVTCHHIPRHHVRPVRAGVSALCGAAAPAVHASPWLQIREGFDVASPPRRRRRRRPRSHCVKLRRNSAYRRPEVARNAISGLSTPVKARLMATLNTTYASRRQMTASSGCPNSRELLCPILQP